MKMSENLISISNLFRSWGSSLSLILVVFDGFWQVSDSTGSPFEDFEDVDYYEWEVLALRLTETWN